jgi:hypothetical protein
MEQDGAVGLRGGLVLLLRASAACKSEHHKQGQEF